LAALSKDPPKDVDKAAEAEGVSEDAETTNQHRGDRPKPETCPIWNVTGVETKGTWPEIAPTGGANNETSPTEGARPTLGQKKWRRKTKISSSTRETSKGQGLW